MTLQNNANFAVKRHGGMDPDKAQKMAEQNLQAADLYVFCPDCKTKRTGTLEQLLEQLQEGCGCADSST